MLHTFARLTLHHIRHWLPSPAEQKLRFLAAQDRKAQQFHLPKVPISPLEKGRQFFQQGQYSEALSCFQLVIEEQPNNSWGWHGRGDALQLLGEYAGALEAYEKAISLAAQQGIHHAGRANALRAQGRLREAEQAQQKAQVFGTPARS